MSVDNRRGTSSRLDTARVAFKAREPRNLWPEQENCSCLGLGLWCYASKHRTVRGFCIWIHEHTYGFDESRVHYTSFNPPEAAQKAEGVARAASFCACSPPVREGWPTALPLRSISGSGDVAACLTYLPFHRQEVMREEEVLSVTCRFPDLRSRDGQSDSTKIPPQIGRFGFGDVCPSSSVGFGTT